jgi:hypothetical protein
MGIEDPTDFKRGFSKIYKQTFDSSETEATQLLEESVDLRIMTVEHFRTV